MHYINSLKIYRKDQLKFSKDKIKYLSNIRTQRDLLTLGTSLFTTVFKISIHSVRFC